MFTCTIPGFKHKMVSSAVSGAGQSCKSITKTFSERMLSPEDRITNEYNIDAAVHSPEYEFHFSTLADLGTDNSKDHSIVITATYYCKFTNPKQIASDTDPVVTTMVTGN